MVALWIVLGLGALLSALLGMLFLSFGIGTLRAAGRIADTVTSPIRSVAIGFAELKGRADRTNPQTLIAPFSKRPCVYYEATIERYEKTGSGKDEKTTWVRNRTVRDLIPFSIEDGTGSIPIAVNRSTISIAADREWRARSLPVKAFETLASFDASIDTYPMIEPSQDSLIASVGTYRLRERIIDFEKELYVIGTVKRDSSGVRVDLDRFHGPFLISDQPEQRLVMTMRITGWVLIAVSLMILVPMAFIVLGTLISGLA
jgi:hypothetical protein